QPFEAKDRISPQVRPSSERAWVRTFVREPTRKRASSRKARGPGALDRSRVACDLERVEVLPELDGPAVANRRDVGDLCFAFLSLPVKPEVIVAESHNSLTAVALKDLVRIKDEFVETRR